MHVFYDKLEDQNLHLASQLARHRDDLQGFYSRICKQNRELKDLLNKLDLQKMEELERQRGEVAEHRLADSGAGDGLDANITYRFTGE